MNTQFLKKEYNGFTLGDTLASRLQFSGIVRFHEREQRIIPENPGRPETIYWVLKDEFGARFSCFNTELVENIEFYVPYEINGDIRIGKGGTYFNLKTAHPFCGTGFKENPAPQNDKCEQGCSHP